ncbi:MAG: PspA/IM30 family protein [Gammaproteobacteria bacterium]|nr:PspA/IM30 family protein [Gammaproteobacteria bacterium]MDH5800027.1 PspA/IM30 family protein [Gammaproteobacteria bacterium]
MALIQRLTRLFKADFHAVLDNVEEPLSLLKQSIREMEDDLHRNQFSLKQQQQALQHNHSRQEDTKTILQGIETDLNTCFESGNEALARSTVKRKLATQRLEQSLKRQQQSLQEEIDHLSHRTRENQARLESMRQKLEVFSDQEIHPYQDQPKHFNSASISEDEVEIALLQEKQKRSHS